MKLLMPIASLTIILCWLSCGDEELDESKVPSVYSVAIAEPTFEDANAVMLASCAGATCHDGTGSQVAYVNNDSLVRQFASNLAAEIEAGRMPKGKGISSADKETLLNYLNGIAPSAPDSTTDTSTNTSTETSTDTDTSTGISDPTWTLYDALAVSNCSGGSCHSGSGGQQAYVGDESLVTTRKSFIITELNAGRMPKNQSISAADKQTLLNYLNGL